MRKPKLGFITISCPEVVEDQNKTGDDWGTENNLKIIVKELEKNNLELIRVNKVITRFYQLFEVEKKFHIEDVDAIFIYISTWNWADQVTQFIRNMRKPVIVYAINDSRVWSIGGLGATKGGFDEIGIDSRLIYGNIKDGNIIKKIVSYSKASMAKNILRKSRYGAIGGQAIGILTGIVDANQWLRDFGILTGFLDQYTLVVEGEKIPLEEIRDCYNKIKEEYRAVPEFNDVFEKSIRIYLALEKIIKQEHYDFIGVKCMFDLSDNYCSACLAQSRLANRDYVSACIGDCNSALSAYILSLLKDENEPIFTTDVNLASRENNTITLVDDGAAPSKLTLDPKKEAELHFQPKLECKASGICTKLFAKPGKVTLIRFSRVNSKYICHLTKGESIAVSDREKEEIMNESGFPMWPHALVKIDGSIDKFVENLRSEYIHMTYGSLKNEIKDFCEIFNIDLIED